MIRKDVTDRNSYKSVWVTLIVVAALALRLAGARGDLSYDEVWTLDLLQDVTSPGQIFWKINHDNNHFLNSLWLYYVGPQASVLLQRGLSIVLGMATLQAVWLWAKPPARMLTLALFAIAMPMVTYGSEARGYAGLILCTILAAAMGERALQGRSRAWLLGLVALLGMLSHLTMIFSLMAMTVWTLWVIAERSGYKQAGALTIRLFAPSALLTLPVVACVAIPLAQHRFVFGTYEPFDYSTILTWASLLRACVRLGPLMDLPSYLFLASGALWLAHRQRVIEPDRWKLYAIAIIGVPVVLIASHLNNIDQPRYYLISGIFLMLLLCELAAYRWPDRRIQAAALALTVLIAASEITLTARFLIHGRGHYQEAIEAMTATGSATYATPDTSHTVMMATHYAKQLGVSVTNIPKTEWCATKPDWLLTYRFTHEAPPALQTLDGTDCHLIFAQPQSFGYFGMTGFTWDLYQRVR